MPIKSEWICDLPNFLMLADELHAEMNASGATTRTSTTYNIDRQIVIHFSKDGEPVLIEILDAKEFVLNTLSCVIKEKEVTI